MTIALRPKLGRASRQETACPPKTHDPTRPPVPFTSRPACSPSSSLALTAALAGCGDKKDKPALQTAAKVNKEEITVSQINQVLAQQRALPADQAASASGRRPRAPDRPGTGPAEGERPEARSRAAGDAADRGRAPRDHLPRLRREDRRRRAQADAGRGQAPTTRSIRRCSPTAASTTCRRSTSRPRRRSSRRVKAALAAAKTFAVFIDYLKANSIKFQGYGGRSRRRAAAARQHRAVRRTSRTARRSSSPGRTAPASSISSARAASRSTCSAATPAIEQFLLNERKRKLDRRRPARPARRRQDRIRRRLRGATSRRRCRCRPPTRRR